MDQSSTSTDGSEGGSISAARPRSMFLGRGVLYLTVLECRDLVGRSEIYGRYDPYVMICYGHQTAFTEVKRNAGSSAKWDETFRFPLRKRTNLKEELKLKVYDRNIILKNNLMGEVSLDLGEFTGLTTESGWSRVNFWKQLILKRDEGIEELRGEILLSIRFEEMKMKDMMDDTTLVDQAMEMPIGRKRDVVKAVVTAPVEFLAGTLHSVAGSTAWRGTKANEDAG